MELTQTHRSRVSVPFRLQSVVLLVAGFALFVPIAQGVTVSIDSKSSTPGSIVVLKLKLSGGLEPYAGFNCRLTLPPKVKLSAISSGDLTGTGFISEFYQGENSLNAGVLVYSTTNSISQNSGVLLHLTLEIGSDAALQQHSIPIVNAALSNLTGSTSIEPDTEQGTLTVGNGPIKVPLIMGVIGSGTTSPPVGVHDFDLGSNVPISATAADNWHFVRWEGDAGGSNNPRTVSMNGPRVVTAVFAQQFTLTMATEGQGTTTPADGAHQYDAGTSVEISAEAATGWVFDHWAVDHDGGANPSNVTVDGNITVKAVFVKQYTLTVKKRGEGTVTPGVGKHKYKDGEVVPIGAEPAADWRFDHWEGALEGSDSDEQITMESDKTVTAVFESTGLTLTSPNGGERWKQNSSHEITWTSQGSVGNRVKIELYKKGTFKKIIKNNAANSGHFTWKVAGKVGKGYTVRISSLNDEEIFDDSDEPFKITEPAKIWEEVLPIDENGQPFVDVARSHPIALRLTSETPIAPDTVWATLEGDGVYENGGMWRAVPSKEGFDGWVMLYPISALTPAQVYTLRVGVLTVAGDPLEASRQFLAIDSTASSGKEALPAEAVENSVQEIVDPPGTRAGRGKPVSPVYRIVPSEVFEQAAPVLVRVSADVDPASIEICYYSPSADHKGWYSSAEVEGWLIPESISFIPSDGELSVNFEVNHGGFFQLRTVKGVEVTQ